MVKHCKIIGCLFRCGKSGHGWGCQNVRGSPGILFIMSVLKLSTNMFRTEMKARCMQALGSQMISGGKRKCMASSMLEVQERKARQWRSPEQSSPILSMRLVNAASAFVRIGVCRGCYFATAWHDGSNLTKVTASKEGFTSKWKIISLHYIAAQIIGLTDEICTC